MAKSCSVDGCTNQGQLTRGWCATHYSRWRLHGDVQAGIPIERKASLPRACSVPGCDRPPLARGWCATHYQRWRTTGDPGGAELLRTPGDPDATEKRCTKCGEVKKIDDFYPDKRTRDGRGSHCRPCADSAQSLRRLRRLYGLSPEQYGEMFARQAGRCPICNERRVLVVDHCHKTDKVRALLCDRCNRLLGVADDDIELLQAAIRFLRKHR